MTKYLEENMKKIIAVCLLAFLFWGCSGEVKSRSEKELLDHYLTFHREKNLEGAMRLYYQKGTPPQVLSTVRKMTKKNFDYTVTSAEITDIPPEKLAKVEDGYPFDGKLLVPNLKPLKQMALKYDLAAQPKDHQARGSSIMIGKDGDFYYFVLSREKPQKELKVKIK
jgi:hypothetical protein